MEMLICSEVDFRSGLWYCKAMEGIRKTASKKGVTIRETDENMIFDLSGEELFGNRNRLLTVIGASDRLMERLIPVCRAKSRRSCPRAASTMTSAAGSVENTQSARRHSTQAW